MKPIVAFRRQGLVRTLTLLLLLLLGIGEGAGRRASAEGTVTTNSTAALLGAMLGGGVVRLNISETLTLETPVIVGTDTVLENGTTTARAVTISGGGLHRLFRVLPGVRFEVRNLVLREGVAARGGAILNEGVLIASNVVFTACEATGLAGVAGADGDVEFGFGEAGGHGLPGDPATGGALHNVGTALLDGCTFNVNEAAGGNGGAGGKGGVGSSRTGRGGRGGQGASGFGGAISSSGRLEVLRCVFAGNAARGGIGGEGGSNGTTVGAGHGGNGAPAAGGAVHSTGWLLIAESSFTTNLVAGGTSAAGGAPEFNIGLDGPGGGAAWGGAVASWSTGIVVNTTFYTNLMAGGTGGAGAAGSFTVGDGGAGGNALGAAIHARGWLSVTNVTFAWNTGTAGLGGAAGTGGGAEAGPNGRLAGGAIAADAGTAATVVNSILATATATGTLSTADGPVTDAGHNLFTDAGTGTPAVGSIFGTDPLLGPYQVWSVGTPGCLPRSGSPVVDRARVDATPSVDQRGLPRPGGFGPDIGALEVGALTFFIGGEVLNGTAGVAGVSVRVGTNIVVTGESGRFRAGPFPAGFYTVEVVDGAGLYTPPLVQLALAADVTTLVFRARRPVLTLVHNAVPGSDALTASGVPNAVHHLEGSPDLANWVRLESATSDAAGRVVFVHAPGVRTAWFYRVVVD